MSTAIVSTSEVERARGEIVQAVTDAQRHLLLQKTPPEVVKYRPGRGGKEQAYVEQAWVNEQLNLIFGWDWDWQILEWRMLPAGGEPLEVVVHGQLTVRTSKGIIIKTQFGGSDVKRQNGKVISLADDLKAASSDALKKCASMLGLALDLYRSETHSNGNGSEQLARPGRKPDAMTNYWQAVKTRRMSDEQAKVILARFDGDPAQALSYLQGHRGV